MISGIIESKRESESFIEWNCKNCNKYDLLLEPRIFRYKKLLVKKTLSIKSWWQDYVKFYLELWRVYYALYIILAANIWIWNIFILWEWCYICCKVLIKLINLKVVPVILGTKLWNEINVVENIIKTSKQNLSLPFNISNIFSVNLSQKML